MADSDFVLSKKITDGFDVASCEVITIDNISEYLKREKLSTDLFLEKLFVEWEIDEEEIKRVILELEKSKLDLVGKRL